MPFVIIHSKPRSLFRNSSVAGPGLGTENWLHRSDAGTDTHPAWRICFGREGQELPMFHGRESHRDEEFIKLLQGGSLLYFPAKSMSGLVPPAENLPFLIAAQGKTLPSEPIVSHRGTISVSWFPVSELCVKIRGHNESKRHPLFPIRSKVCTRQRLMGH